MKRHNGFTLIELLVVVTIIVVLLALLVPAMDKAIYQAELASCGAHLKAVGTGVQTYAIDFGRRYPHRPAVHDEQTGGFQADQLTYPYSADQKGNVFGYDDRPMLRSHLQMKALLCPLAAGIDLESSPATSWVYSNYALWFGWKFRVEGGGMLKLGSKLKWGNDSFGVLAADHNYNVPGFGDVLESTHPDLKAGVLSLYQYQDDLDPVSNGLRGDPDGNITRSYWGTSYFAGNMDLNYLFDDGAVRTFADVDHKLGAGEKRMVRVPNSPNATTAVFYQLMPRAR